MHSVIYILGLAALAAIIANMKGEKRPPPDWPAAVQSAHEANVRAYDEENCTRLVFGTGECLIEDMQRVIMLHNIQVFSGHRRRGIGSKLIDAVKKIAREKRKPILLSFSPEDGHEDELRRFYKRHGFSFLSDNSTMRWKP